MDIAAIQSNLKEQFLSKDLLQKNERINKKYIEQLKSNTQFMSWLENNDCTPEENEDNYFEYTFLYLLFRQNSLPIEIERIESDREHADFKVCNANSRFIIELTSYHLTLKSISKYNKLNNDTLRRLKTETNMLHEINFEAHYATLLFGLHKIADTINTKCRQVNTSAENIKDGDKQFTKIVIIDASQYIPDALIKNNLFLSFLSSKMKYNRSLTQCIRTTNVPELGNSDKIRSFENTLNMLRDELCNQNINLIVNFEDQLAYTNYINKRCFILLPALNKDLVKLIKFQDIFDNSNYLGIQDSSKQKIVV